jgi:uncharacterized protein YeaO (DUF488 family)
MIGPCRRGSGCSSKGIRTGFANPLRGWRPDGFAAAMKARILAAAEPAPGIPFRCEADMSEAIPADRIRLKRAYDAPAADDGVRVLVDRLWPRGLRKADAAIALWMKDVAPSTELRQWFGHDPARWPEFRRRYEAELRGRADRIEELREMARHGPITLLFAARDEAHNDAVALRELLLRKPHG